MRRRQIKQLMALGIQRNDANAFLNVYNTVVKKRKEDLLPVILRPVPIPRIQTEECRVVPIRSMVIVPHNKLALVSDFELSPSGYFTEAIKRKLEEEILNGLRREGAIEFKSRSAGTLGVEYYSMLRVLMPY